MSDNSKLQVYKCPSCGGAVRYDAAAGSLACQWCGNSYEAADLSVKEAKSTLQGYLCPECGSKLMADDFIAADTCPYCGNNEIAPHRFDGDFEPDFVIPFSVTKRQAVECYETALAQKEYLPDDFIAESQVVSVQGTYVPFWLQAGVVDFDLTYFCDDGHAKNTSYSYHRRAGTYAYARVPADGSERMADDMMDSIEPYDYDALEPFSTEYLPGFVAERYTVAQDEVNHRVDLRVKNSAWLAARDTIPKKWKNRYGEGKRSRAVVNHSSAEQALLPVWLIVVRYHDAKYLVGVNGQTGKVAVNLPIDEKKQRRKAWKEALKDSLITLTVFLVAILGIILVMIWSFGFNETVETLASLPGALGRVDFSSDWKTTYMIVGVSVVFLVMLVGGGAFAYVIAKRKVVASMQNVQTAVNAQQFDIGGLDLTISEMKKGPKQSDNNWPE